MKTEIERRFTLRAQDVTTGDSDGIRYIEGYAAIYDSTYEICPGYSETIQRGFFDGMDMTNVVALFNHNDNMLLGRSSEKASTLTLKIDDKGLFFRVTDSGTTVFDNAHKDITNRNIEGCSFAFSVKEDKYENKEDGTTLRTLVKGSVLYDVGPVVHPAYMDTEVEAYKRSASARTGIPMPVNYYNNLKLKLA